MGVITTVRFRLWVAARDQSKHDWCPCQEHALSDGTHHRTPPGFGAAELEDEDSTDDELEQADEADEETDDDAGDAVDDDGDTGDAAGDDDAAHGLDVPSEPKGSEAGPEGSGDASRSGGSDAADEAPPMG